jgi:hypothetical protein
VLSTEEWALEMVPQPVLAVLFLYPIKDTVRLVKSTSKVARGQKPKTDWPCFIRAV